MTKLKFSKVDQYGDEFIGTASEYMVIQDGQPIGYVRKRREHYIQFGTYTYWIAYTLYNHQRQRIAIDKSCRTRQQAAEAIVTAIAQSIYP